ncbi:MAG TPA: hypothetical protein VGO78_09725, partial [Acidimicrobiales bacterium]|nr:hypothetical protein [Acidimicrobiales bacterium]
GIAAALMVMGIALFGVLTANLAAFMLERDITDAGDAGEGGSEAVAARLDRIEAQMAVLLRALGQEGVGVGGVVAEGEGGEP